MSEIRMADSTATDDTNARTHELDDMLAAMSKQPPGDFAPAKADAAAMPPPPVPRHWRVRRDPEALLDPESTAQPACTRQCRSCKATYDLRHKHRVHLCTACGDQALPRAARQKMARRCSTAVPTSGLDLAEDSDGKKLWWTCPLCGWRVNWKYKWASTQKQKHVATRHPTHKWALKVVRARFEVAPLPPGETASWQCPFCPQGLVAAATGKAAQYARRCHWERCHPDKPWKAFVVSGAQRIRTYQQRGVVGTRNAGAARRIQAIRSGVAKPHQPVFFQHRVGKRKGRTDLFCVKCRAVGTSPSDLASKRCTDSARKPRDLTWRITELRKAKRTAPMDQRPAFETLIELFSKEPAEGIIAAPQRHASTAAAVAAASTQRSAATSASRTGTDLAHQQQ